MNATHFRARWASKPRAEMVRKTGQALVLETFNGFIVIEPSSRHLGDGLILNRQEANYELQPAWYSGSMSRLREARQRLGLESGALVAATA
ncbi:MAG TPA: hypothetical protein VFA18_14325 [Gemmataceae bacterium]|nr:hypothetical protein [Gemmataceae bacterium]